jgi:hypothetical protein
MSKSNEKNEEELTVIPGVGESTKRDFILLGINKVSELKGCGPQELYDRLCEITQAKQDRCVLYVYRCAVYYAEGGRDSEKLKWRNWKDEKKYKENKPR